MTPSGEPARGDGAGSGGASGPGVILTELEAVLRDRARNPTSGSYSATLLADPQLVSRKIVEEAFEVTWELGRPEVDAGRVASEAADVIFHLLAGLVGAGVDLDDVWAELEARRRPGTASGAPVGEDSA